MKAFFRVGLRIPVDKSPVSDNILEMKIVSTKKLERYGQKPLSRVRLFVMVQNEKLRENLAKRFDRPYKAYRAEVLPKVLKNELWLAKASWSQTAGCSCGCSPGFFLDIDPAKVGYEAVFVTIGK